MSKESQQVSDLCVGSADDLTLTWTNLLPKVITELKDSTGSKISKYIRTLFTSVVPCMPVIELETAVFSQVCDKIVSEFTNLLDSIKEQILVTVALNEVKEITDRVLQNCVDILDSLSVCVEYFIASTCNPTLSDVRSFSRTVLLVLDTAYIHCKASYGVYGEWFDVVSDGLAALFQRTCNLQKVFCQCLEQLTSSSSSETYEEKSEDICYIIEKMSFLTDSVTDLDIKASLSLWKTISKLCSRYNELVCRDLDIEQVLVTLINRMSSCCESIQCSLLVEGGRNDGLMNEIRLLGCYMRVLVSLSRDYVEFIRGSEALNALVNILTHIQSLLLGRGVEGFAGSGGSEEQLSELRRQIGTGVEPLLSTFISNKSFLSCLLNKSNCQGELYEDKSVGRLSLLCVVMTLLPLQSEEIRQYLLLSDSCRENSDRENLISAIFSCIPHCYVELCYPVHFPGIMLHGQPHREVSLYEHVLTRMCAVVACFPAQHFSLLEKILLRNVLEESLHRSLLASDVWCFIARYGTAELCRDQCRVLVEIYMSIGNIQLAECRHLSSLLRLLFKLLSEQHQIEILTDLSSRISSGSDNLAVFSLLSDLSFNHLTPPSLAQAVDMLTPPCVASVNEYLQHSDNSSSNDTIMKTSAAALSCLSSIMSAALLPHDHPPSPQLSHTLNLHLTSTLNLCTSAIKRLTQDSHRSLMIGVVRLVTSLAKNLSHDVIAQTLEQCSRMIVNDFEEDDYIEVVTLSLIEAISSFFFNPPAQSEILSVLPKLCRRLIQSDNSVIHQMSLVVFSHLAEVTPHESILLDTLNKHADDDRADRKSVKQLAVDYINKMSSGEYDQRVDVDIIINQWNSLKVGHTEETGMGVNMDREPSADTITEVSNNHRGQHSHKRCKSCKRVAIVAGLSMLDAIPDPALKKLKIEAEEEQNDKQREKADVELQKCLSALSLGMDTLENLINHSNHLRPSPPWLQGTLQDLRHRLDALL